MSRLTHASEGAGAAGRGAKEESYIRDVANHRLAERFHPHLLNHLHPARLLAVAKQAD